MFEKAKLGIILLSSDRIDFYTEGLPNVLTYYFPKELISDLDVKNKEEFEIQMQSFISRNRFTPMQLILVLSESVTFEKDIPPSPEYNFDVELNKFAEMVPFEHTSTKLFLQSTGGKVISTNKILFETIKGAFDKQGLFVVLVIPAFVVKELGLSNGLNASNALAIMAKIDVLRLHDMLYIENHKQAEKREKEKKESGSRIYVLLGVLFVLMLVLGVLMYKTYIVK